MSKERESEGQIAAAPSLFSFLYLLSLPPSLSPSTFHSRSSTFAFVLLFSPVSLIFYILLFPWVFFFFFLLRHLHTLRSLFQFHSLGLHAWFATRTCTYVQHVNAVMHMNSHTCAISLLCLRWSHHKHTHTSITSILLSSSPSKMHRDIKIHRGYTIEGDQLNLICLSAPDGSEEWFQLINNASSTCIKLNRCLLVIMNVLMGLSDRSGA